MRILGWLIDVRDNGRVLRGRINRQSCMCGHFHKSEQAAEKCVLKWLKTRRHEREPQEINLQPSRSAIREAMKRLEMYQCVGPLNNPVEMTTGSLSIQQVQELFTEILSIPDFNVPPKPKRGDSK